MEAPPSGAPADLPLAPLTYFQILDPGVRELIAEEVKRAYLAGDEKDDRLAVVKHVRKRSSRRDDAYIDSMLSALKAGRRIRHRWAEPAENTPLYALQVAKFIKKPR